MKSKDPRAKIYLRHVENRLLAISFITVGELLFGAVKNKWGERRIDDLKQRLRSVVIVPYDYELCSTYADLKARLEADGNKIGDNDLWIAACAVRHGVPLVSNNRRHFERVPGLRLISEEAATREIQSQGKLALDTTEPTPT